MFSGYTIPWPTNKSFLRLAIPRVKKRQINKEISGGGEGGGWVVTATKPVRLCSAAFEQLLVSGATFCGSSSLEQVLPF